MADGIQGSGSGSSIVPRPSALLPLSIWILVTFSQLSSAQGVGRGASKQQELVACFFEIALEVLV